MEANKRIKSKRQNYPEQEFNGISYHLYKGERYYSRHTTRMHTAVWEYYNGEIPNSFHIHHIDSNPENNKIENLCIRNAKEHLSEHSKIWHENNKEKTKTHLAKIRPLASEWHKSEVGRAWHREHAKTFNFGAVDYGVVNCEVCNNEFKKKTSYQRFCSNKCKSKYRRTLGIDNIQKKCKLCDKLFTANKYSRVEFCSKSCSGRYSKFKRQQASL